MEKKDLKFTKKQELWITNRMIDFSKDLSEKMGIEFLEQIQSYKDDIVDKIDVLSQMGVEMIPTENLYNMFDGKETDTEEKKIGF
jgi:hypothetical protein